MENRKKQLEKMIYSLNCQADSFEKEIFKKTTLREEAVRLSWKYKQELEEISHNSSSTTCLDMNALNEYKKTQSKSNTKKEKSQ